ncbi:hypothetical protein HAX54_043450 [Datura stramonium]|uniref:Uncharacterized protein n=1 Tax=Datura stramonium TaxID=4076 RepID=A0ABS8RR29_DATST|nr:hypothetical protein [Datura stramonium]
MTMDLRGVQEREHLYQLFAVTMILHLRSLLLATENVPLYQRLLNFPEDINLGKLIIKPSLQALAVDANNSAPVIDHTGVYRTESDPTPSTVDKGRKVPKSSVRRSLLKDLAQQPGVDEDAEKLIDDEKIEQEVPVDLVGQDDNDGNLTCTSETVGLLEVPLVNRILLSSQIPRAPLVVQMMWK